MSTTTGESLNKAITKVHLNSRKLNHISIYLRNDISFFFYTYSKTKVPGPSGSTAKFCYISGNSLCHCRDVLQSKSQVDSFGNLRYYSFEACTTPPRNNCQSFGLQNLGDGDFPYCDNGSDDICTNLYQQLDDNGCVDYG